MLLGRVALAMIVVMIIEMILLIKIGGALGALTTVALVFVTAFIGVWMMKRQGMTNMQRAMRSLQQGTAPVKEGATAVFLLFGGFLLLVPGFFTDFIGFLLLLPPTRALLIRWFTRRTASFTAYTTSAQVADTEPRLHRRPQGRVIEGDYRDDSRHDNP